MSSKRDKVRAKKEAEKAKTELINAKRRLMNNAREVENLMTLVPMFSNFAKEDLKAVVKSFNKMPEHLEEWAFNLIRQNMQKFIEDAWGWDEEVKESELYHEDSRFLIGFIKDIPFGFIHFRYEQENGEVSLFVYDIHVEEELRRKGFGKFLLQATEFIGLKLGFDNVLVSVLKDCAIGRQFFRKMNYKVHKNSPAIADPENEFEYAFELLYKPLKKETK